MFELIDSIKITGDQELQTLKITLRCPICHSVGNNRIEFSINDPISKEALEKNLQDNYICLSCKYQCKPKEKW